MAKQISISGKDLIKGISKNSLYPSLPEKGEGLRSIKGNVFRDALKILERIGFEVVKVNGSHHRLKHPDGCITNALCVEMIIFLKAC